MSVMIRTGTCLARLRPRDVISNNGVAPSTRYVTASDEMRVSYRGYTLIHIGKSKWHICRPLI